ncbi:MAG: hypothetical protein OXQ92_04995 [Boseongicola sp.]|nr:hypothetical protein [Boseongicola sp.]MDD9976934.1 hypothetical protein [Boseongicola sp.]
MDHASLVGAILTDQFLKQNQPAMSDDDFYAAFGQSSVMDATERLARTVVLFCKGMRAAWHAFRAVTRSPARDAMGQI